MHLHRCTPDYRCCSSLRQADPTTAWRQPVAQAPVAMAEKEIAADMRARVAAWEKEAGAAEAGTVVESMVVRVVWAGSVGVMAGMVAAPMCAEGQEAQWTGANSIRLASLARARLERATPCGRSCHSESNRRIQNLVELDSSPSVAAMRRFLCAARAIRCLSTAPPTHR